MKVALCLFGHLGGKKINDGQISHQNLRQSLSAEAYKKTILDGNDTDIFIHSWSENYRNQIISLFSPTDSLIEKQKDFSSERLDDYLQNDIDSYSRDFNLDNQKTIHKINDLIIRSSSRWYSNCKAIAMMMDYSHKNKINYDFVFQGRIDLILTSKIDFSSLNPNYFYHPIRRNSDSQCIDDYFFISNQKNAEIFSEIYKNKNKYSIRPVVAAKQHLDESNIETKGYLEVHKDFIWIRIQEERIDQMKILSRLKRILLNPANTLKRILKKITNIRFR
tara:strand:+ start:15159 stop:15989 length:831 start_codon:yes stop_codon:yes gene_type:complete